VRWTSPETLNGSAVAGYRVQMRELPAAGAAGAAAAAAAAAGAAGAESRLDGGAGGGWVTAFTGATATALSFKTTRLKPATAYEFRVAADTTEGVHHGDGVVGPSDFSVAASVTTPYRPPTPPAMPEATATTDTCITVAWSVEAGGRGSDGRETTDGREATVGLCRLNHVDP
jgi:hypothetical protein